MSPDDVDDLLATARTMSLATIGPDGWPNAVARQIRARIIYAVTPVATVSWDHRKTKGAAAMRNPPSNSRGER